MSKSIYMVIHVYRHTFATPGILAAILPRSCRSHKKMVSIRTHNHNRNDDGCMDGWMGGWVGGWMDICMDGWVDGWMNGWMDGWMDAWMNG